MNGFDALQPNKPLKGGESIKSTKKQPAKTTTAAEKKRTATKKAASSKTWSQDDSPDGELAAKKQPAKKGKRGKAVILDSSDEDSDSAMLSLKKPTTAKGKVVKVSVRIPNVH